MHILRWVLVAASSLLLGAALIQYMTVHPPLMTFYRVVSAVPAVILIALVALCFRGWLIAGAVVLALAGLVGGYLANAARVLARQDSRPVPCLTRAVGDKGDGHTAVVYFTHGEPESYDPIGWINQFREFDEDGIAFVPFPIRPLFLYQLRSAYMEVGASHHRQIHLQMLQDLTQAYRSAGDTTTRFYIGFLDDHPRPDAAVVQALNEGASRIIVSEVFLTESNHTAEGEDLIKAVDVARFGVDLRFTGPLWDSETLKSMFVRRVNANLDGSSKAEVGILLVGHGQPDEWDAAWPTETQQEMGFRNDILKLLAEDGFSPENMSLAWMEFKQPEPTEKVEEFAARGLQKLLYFPAAISADAIHSQYDIPKLIAKARAPAGYQTINLRAWNDDPIVIKAIKEKIDAQMRP